MESTDRDGAALVKRGAASIAYSVDAWNAALRPTGWAVLELAVNDSTGFVRLIAEARDHSSGKGRKVTITRSGYAGPVLEMRDLVERVPGFGAEWWVVVEGGHLGRQRSESLGDALRLLSDYIATNGPSGPHGLTSAQAVRELQLALGVAP